MVKFVKLNVLAVLLAAAYLGVHVVPAVADVVNTSSRSVLQNEEHPDEESGDEEGEEDHGDHDHGDHGGH